MLFINFIASIIRVIVGLPPPPVGNVEVEIIFTFLIENNCRFLFTTPFLENFDILVEPVGWCMPPAFLIFFKISSLFFILILPSDDRYELFQKWFRRFLANIILPWISQPYVAQRTLAGLWSLTHNCTPIYPINLPRVWAISDPRVIYCVWYKVSQKCDLGHRKAYFM